MIETKKTCAKSCCPAVRYPVDFMLNHRRFLNGAGALAVAMKTGVLDFASSLCAAGSRAPGKPLVRIRTRVIFVVWAVLSCTAGASLWAAETIGSEALVPLPEGALYSRHVNTAPEDGAAVEVNPPRFSWFYAPDPRNATDERVLEFRLQVAYDRKITKPVLDVRTVTNMYNMISPFIEEATCFWRVGYIDPQKGKEVLEWSKVRQFTIPKNTPKWDRSMLADRDYLLSRKHPRLVLTKESLPAIRKLVQSDPAAKKNWLRVKGDADRALAAPWWGKPAGGGGVVSRITGAMNVALAWQITQDKKYLEAKPQNVLVEAARDYVKKGLDRRDARHGQEIQGLAMAHDWLHEVMNPEQRKEVVRAIELNCEFLVKHMWWKRAKGKGNWARAVAGPYKGPFFVSGASGAKGGESHQIDNFNNGMLGALAVYDESKEAMDFLGLGMNYMIAKGYPFGSDGGLNEGVGYSSNVFTEMVNLAIFFHIAFPEAGFDRNPYFRNVGEWWRWIMPVGLTYYHSPWGHGRATQVSSQRWDAWGRELAMLTGDGIILSHWRTQTGGKRRTGYPFLDLALPHYFKEPKAAMDMKCAQVFPREGWAMASTYPPGSKKCFSEGAGFIFQCRPRGGYSHAAWSDLSFQIWAYGRTITDSGGKRGNVPHSTHPMSHYNLMVDGVGQAQSGSGVPYYGRLFAFKEDAEGRYVYCAADATHAYPKGPVRAGGWWGSLSSKVYRKGKGLPYLKKVRRHLLFVRGKYFVVFDELETRAEHPSRFSWLYHIMPNTLKVEKQPLAFTYMCDKVAVHVKHIADPTGLELVELKGRQGFTNPITGEDYWKDKGGKSDEGADLRAHALWVTNKAPKSRMNFLSVIFPVKPRSGAPVITRLDDWTVEVNYGGKRDVVTFNAGMKDRATIFVDLSELEPLPVNDPFAGAAAQ